MVRLIGLLTPTGRSLGYEAQNQQGEERAGPSGDVEGQAVRDAGDEPTDGGAYGYAQVGDRAQQRVGGWAALRLD